MRGQSTLEFLEQVRATRLDGNETVFQAANSGAYLLNFNRAQKVSTR